MADAARPWDGLLSAAVRHGLTSPSSASPDVAALSPFPADTPETGVVEPLGDRPDGNVRGAGGLGAEVQHVGEDQERQRLITASEDR